MSEFIDQYFQRSVIKFRGDGVMKCRFSKGGKCYYVIGSVDCDGDEESMKLCPLWAIANSINGIWGFGIGRRWYYEDAIDTGTGVR